MKRRILSIITALALCLSLCPTWAFAAAADPALCPHHREHTEDCGYTAPTEGHDCGHRHTAECYTLGVLPDADGGDYYEIGADTANLLDCQHSHDSECGYVEADPGASCGYACRICPIEALIAALPEQVTEDNAAIVRGQLDEILDLYRELTEDEQGQLDLSHVTALQEALDAVNVSALAVGGTPDLELFGQEVRSGDSGEGWSYADGVLTLENFHSDSSSENFIHITNSDLEFTLYVKGDNSVKTSGKLIWGSVYGSMTITGEQGASLSLDGKSWSDRYIFIRGVNMDVTMQEMIFLAYDMEIDNATVNFNMNGSNGYIYTTHGGFTIKNGSDVTMTNSSGAVDYCVATNKAVITDSALKITNPSGFGVYVTNISTQVSEYKAFITNSTISADVPDAAIHCEDEMAVTNSQVTGIGRFLLRSKKAITVDDSSTMEGITYEFFKSDTGATYQVYGSHTPAANLTVAEKDSFVIPEGAVLTIPDGIIIENNGTMRIHEKDSLTGTGALTGNGKFLIDVNEDMISIPEGLVYTGKDYTDQIILEENATVCGVEFTADTEGWTRNIEPAVVKEAGEYTVTFTSGNKEISKTFTVAKSGTDLTSEGKVKTYNGSEETTSFTVGDTITVKATPTATGKAPDNSAMFAASFTAPGAGQMAVFVGDTQVSEPVDAVDGTYTMEVSASDVLTLGGVEPNGGPITLTAKFIGNTSMADGTGTATVNITAAAKAERGGAVIGYYGENNLADAFANSGNAGATFTLLANVERPSTLSISINCTLDLNGKTIRSTGEYAPALDISNGATVTIRGEGEIIPKQSHALVVLGSVTLEGGTFTSNGENFAGVYVNGGTLSITGEKVVIQNTSNGGYGLAVNSVQSVQLSAGTYKGEKAVSIVSDTITLGDLLDGGCAYHSGDTPIALEAGGKELTGTVTVKACNHTGEGVCTYAHIENTSTHTKTCLACGQTWEAENCAYTFSGATGTCAACRDSVTVTVSGTDGLIYDGTEKEPGVTVMRGETALTAGTDYTVAYTDNKNAGENKATVTVTIGNGQGNYIQNFTIGRATPTITWVSTSQELTYTSSAAAITAPTVTLVNNEQFTGTINYSYTGTTSGMGLPTDVGIYTIRAHVDAAGNYTAADSGEMTLTINPVDVKLTFNDQTITYGGTPTGATANPASADIKYSYITGEGGEPISGWPTNAGTYTVTAKVEATGNYGEASQTATLTINPKAVSKPTIELSPSSFVYDGAEKKPAVTVKDGEKVIPADEYTVEYSNNTNVGTTATVTITDNPDGNYTVSGTTAFTITAKPLTGAKVEVTGTFTYTGNALTPAPTVTLDGKTLTADTDYTVAYTDNTNAGTAKITVTGKGNYSGTAQGTFTIGRATLTVEGTGTASGTYGDKLSELTVSGLTAKLGEGTVSGTWKLAGGTVPNVGDSGEYTATFTPATGADNYNALTAQVKLNIAKADYTGTTTASTSAKFGATGTYDLSALLPDGATAGTAATDSGIFEGTPEASGKTLTYKLAANATVGNSGTITVPVTSVNYNDFNLTVTVTVTNKDVPTLTVSPITVTYTGEAVPSTAIKGTAKVGDTTVPGAWSFTEGQALTSVADSGTKTVKFVPTDKDTYAEATGTVVVTIGKATPTGAPKYTAISASGKTLADAGLTTEGGTFSTTGTVAWVLGTDTAVTANTQYEWMFTPTDAANYNTLTGKITLWPYTSPSNPGGGGGYVPSGPGTSLPVTTTGQGSTTTTIAAPTANTQGGTATTTINTTMGQEIVKQAVANKSEEVVIAPKVTGSVTKAEVSIPASTVGQIGSQTSASLTVSTPVANVTIPNGGLGSLSSSGGTVTVTAEQTGNSVELTVAAGGKTVQNVPGGVTLTVPASNTTPGTVAVLVHPDGTREVVRKSVAGNGAVTIPLDGSAKLEIVDNSGYFADVPATSWAADAVAFASGHELFNGTAPGRFSPNTPMSRGMLAVVLHNLESNPAQALTGAFADVDDSQWYAEGVAWAEAQGIIGGYGNGRFGPNDNITREQLAVMLWRYAGSPAATDRELHFADADKVSDWALEALRWAVGQSIINGKGGGILDPTGQATRAETAQMLKNFMESK